MPNHRINEVSREHFYLGIEGLGASVIETASGLDFVLNVLELDLELLEVSISFKLRVGLSNRKEAAEGALHGTFSFGGAIDGLGAHSGRASFGDFLKSTLFVFGVTLDGLNDIRNEIGAIFELDCDIRPGLIDPLVKFDETIVRGPERYDENNDDDQDDN